MRRWVVTAAVLSALAAGACGGGARSKDSAALTSTTVPGVAAGAPGAATGAPGAAASSRQIVSTAALAMRVGSVAKAAGQAADVATAAGGYVASQHLNLDGSHAGDLALRVPAPKVNGVLDQLSALGRVATRTSAADDVTDRVVDLEGRLKTAQASADRLRTLLATAPSTNDIVAVEGELTRREADIESMQGELNSTRDKVTMATVDVHLSERALAARNTDIPGFLAGLRTGWVVFVNLAMMIVTLVGALLPFAPLGALVGWLLVRRRRRRRTELAGALAP